MKSADLPPMASLEATLGMKFQNHTLLEQALVHSSYINENTAFALPHNERLEFLGDAVLDVVVAEKLYRDYPALDEGKMTRLRASIVQRDTLAAIARRIKLGEYLLMGKGEESTGGRDKAPNLAGAMEAVIAAIFLDRGFTATAEIILRLLGDIWDSAAAQTFDTKSQLQEVVQSRFQVTPSYKLISETGPEHAKTFTVEVLAGSRVLAGGIGKTKKRAESEAARAALEKLNEDFTS
jgi:ribonuclease-3